MSCNGVYFEGTKGILTIWSYEYAKLLGVIPVIHDFLSTTGLNYCPIDATSTVPTMFALYISTSIRKTFSCRSKLQTTHLIKLIVLTGTWVLFSVYTFFLCKYLTNVVFMTYKCCVYDIKQHEKQCGMKHC